MSIIEQIAKDDRFYGLCIKLAKRKHLADELRQEFHLALCEMGEAKIKELEDKCELNFYCVGMINNIWNKYYNQLGDKKNKNAKTNPFFEYSRISIGEPTYMVDETYNINYDICYKEAVKQIEKDTQSSNRETMFRSRVFNYSVTEYANPRQFSKDSKIPYPSVIFNFNKYKERLVKLLDKYIND